jgi:hypothetical protein
MCRGTFSASSTTSALERGGSCRGFRSQLEILEAEQQLTMTRTEALKRFTTMAADVDMYDYREEGINRHSGHANAGLDEFHQQTTTQTVLLSPALIFKHPTDATNTTMEQGMPDEDQMIVNQLTKEPLLLEEELIVRQDWTCYGSTEVEYMVLQDVSTGHKHIAAVAPRNTGVSVRKIETADSIRTLTRFGLGWLDIIHDSNATLMDEEDNAHEERETTGHGKRDVTSSLPEEVPPRPSIDAVAVAKQSASRMVEFTQQVAQHMQWNATWVWSNLTDDFPSRTYTAGQRIVEQLPRTAQATAQALTKILEQIVGDHGDDNPPGDRRSRN